MIATSNLLLVFCAPAAAIVFPSAALSSTSSSPALSDKNRKRSRNWKETDHDSDGDDAAAAAAAAEAFFPLAAHRRRRCMARAANKRDTCGTHTRTCNSLAAGVPLSWIYYVRRWMIYKFSGYRFFATLLFEPVCGMF